MPVKLRLRRQGRSKAVHYSIVAADVRSPRDGRYIEKIGTYDPIREPGHLYINEAAAIKWLQNGAQPTHTVKQLLRHAGVTLKYALIKQGKSEDQIEAIFGRWWEEKQKRKKKKVLIVDRTGNPLEEAPEAPAPAAPAAEAPAEEAPAADAEASEEAPAAEATEEAPAAEAEASEEAPAAEAAEEEAPAAEAEEAPAEEAEEEKKEG
jgi:small subunit ribosomal protein S16